MTTRLLRTGGDLPPRLCTLSELQVLYFLSSVIFLLLRPRDTPLPPPHLGLGLGR